MRIEIERMRGRDEHGEIVEQLRAAKRITKRYKNDWIYPSP
jgi:hypothetical protein